MNKRCKHIFSALLSVFLLCSFIPAAAAAAEVPEGYTGVYTIEDLYAIRNQLTKNYILMADIDLSEATAEGGEWDNGYGWAPIGENADTPFSGNFDGHGHTITGLQIRNIQTKYAGLFGYATGNLRDLILTDVSITTSTNTTYSGALAGYATGNIEQINIDNAEINTASEYTGGVVGYYAGAQISNCVTTGNVCAAVSMQSYDAYAYIGGILGFADSAVVSCCTNKARVYTALNNKKEKQAYATYYSGGIAGQAKTITSCYNIGNVSASVSTHVSGGYDGGGYYHYWYHYTNGSAISHAGGICGKSEIIEFCYNFGEITATSFARCDGSDIITNSHAYANGIGDSNTLKQCINYGSLSASNGSYNTSSEGIRYALGSGTLQSCYYLRGTASTGGSGTDTVSTAVALSETQMGLRSAFGNLDFKDVWFLDPETGINRPQLKDNPEGEPHVCVFGNEIVTNPTCTEQGYTTHYCHACDSTIVDEFVDPIGHAWDNGVVTTAPDCTTEGIRTYTCLNDTTHEKTEVIPALGHNFVPEITAPTCTAKGYTTYTCARCSDSYKDDQTEPTGHAWDEGAITTPPSCLKNGVRTFVCQNDSTHTRTQTVPATGHLWNAGEITTPPTCTTDGTKTFTCQYDITHTYTEVIPALGHDYHPVVTAPTCTARGYTTYVCSRCGGSYKTEYTNAVGHKWDDGDVTAEPTCTENGVRTFTCMNDPTHTRTEPITKLGHAYNAVVTAPTCTEKGFTTYTCDRCGDVYQDNYTAASGHAWGGGYVSNAATCETDGEMLFICQNDSTHTRTERIPAFGHKWDNGAITAEPTCTADGVRTFTCEHDPNHTYTELIAKTGHKYQAVITEPTCTETGFTTYRCSACGNSYTDNETAELGHNYKLANETKPTCTADGSAVYTCTRCSDSYTETIDALGHSYRTSITAPTCEEKGYTTYICTRCDETHTDDYVDALDHAWNAGKVTKQPTCTEEGIKTFTCTRDRSHTKTEPIPAKGHVSTAVVTAPTCTEKGFTTCTCSVCGDSYTTDEKPALGHSCETWTQTKAPTVYAEGEKTGTCSRCSNTMTQTIPKLPMPKVNIQNFTASSKAYDYRSTITFKATVEKPLTGGQIHWFVDGKEVATGDTYTAGNVKQGFSLQAKYYADGKEIPEASTEVEKVNVNTGFFAKLKAFFRSLFGLLPKVTQEYLGIEIIDRVLPD